MSFYNKHLKENPWSPMHNLWKIARDLTIARLGGYYAAYHDHYMQCDDPADSKKYGRFRCFRGPGIFIRHENVKDSLQSKAKI